MSAALIVVSVVVAVVVMMTLVQPPTYQPLGSECSDVYAIEEWTAQMSHPQGDYQVLCSFGVEGQGVEVCQNKFPGDSLLDLCEAFQASAGSPQAFTYEASETFGARFFVPVHHREMHINGRRYFMPQTTLTIRQMLHHANPILMTSGEKPQPIKGRADLFEAQLDAVNTQSLTFDLEYVETVWTARRPASCIEIDLNIVPPRSRLSTHPASSLVLLSYGAL